MKKSIMCLGAAGILVGWASAPVSASAPPTLQTAPEVTFDGLHRVENSALALGYMKPGVDLRGYTAIMLDPVAVSYQKDPGNRYSRGTGGGDNNFALNSRQMENFKGWFQEAVVEALSADDGYQIVYAPGPDVLRINAQLIDLIVRTPTQQTGGRGQTTTRSYYEVTVVVEAYDSETGEILARAAERRDPTNNPRDELVSVVPGIVQANTRALFGYWAAVMRTRLDELREVQVEPIP